MLPACHAQKLLNENISVSVRNQPVAQVLKLIEEQGKFAFSYNSDIVPGDSLVSVSVKSVSVKRVLEIMLQGKYLLREKGNYIIIQRAPKEKYYHITGQVLDFETKKEVDYASVYSKQQLVSDLTDDAGLFKLRFHDRTFPYTLTFSKIGYADTSIVVNSETDSGIKVFIYPKAIDLDTLVITNSEKSHFWLARLLVSSRLRAQSRNLSNFFIALPFQASLTPGLSTHGRLSPQITNKFSLNIYGGYTAGVNGVEIGGLFNISKKDARYLQMATTFNAVAGNFKGLQIVGIYNQIMDSLSGVQLSGAGGFVHGLVKGVQISGAGNFARGGIHGAQISSLGNISGKNMRGLQVAAVFNYAKNLKGVQIGMVNLSDTSSGYSIGFLNIVKKGSGQVSLYANELVPWNIAWKSGNSKLYNIFIVGSSMNIRHKANIFGFGFGHEFILNKNLKFNTEITHQSIYLGKWTNQPIVYRLQTGLDIKLSKQFSLNAGPSFSLFSSQQKEFKTDYQSFADKGFFRFKVGQNAQAWLGWQGGLSWNYRRF
ncbi:carboxypeptidase-like regulatory domain-containing protein [Dyadobacter frigoris]|uniref:Carboxypeptidase-like regulatory domain-containing protein n=1 Tax=Dyadobacter frigoris TaxID=2576211 RepID=A0A4U6CUW6_9BACT|nr:carboxypeptidase-like regulatory domain-containing protein [Dyadobacter frigoris]